MADKTHRFKVGNFEGIVIHEGQITGTLGFFPDIPAEELERAVRSLNYDPEKVPLSYSPFAINTGNQWMLIDAGHGEDEEYDWGRMPQILRSEGIAPEDIHTIFITHCHDDHIGGLAGEDGTLTYPNARCVMLKDEWEYWMSEKMHAELRADDDEEYVAFLCENLNPIREKLTLLDIESEIVPGVYAAPLTGHTPGHSGVLFESGGERMLDIADAAHSLVQLAHPDWSPRFDENPKQGAITRRRLFERAAREKLLVKSFHFPFPGLGYIVEKGDAFEWKPVAE